MLLSEFEDSLLSLSLSTSNYGRELIPKSPKVFNEYYYENFLAIGDRLS